MYRGIETPSYHYFCCLFYIEAAVIWCYQAFGFCRLKRNPSGFGKVCFELLETYLAAQNPCRMFGWSYSKVVIPIAGFHAPFFLLCFHRDWRRKEKTDKSCWTYRLMFQWRCLHRGIVDFSEGVDCILFQTVNDMEVSLRHLY